MLRYKKKGDFRNRISPFFDFRIINFSFTENQSEPESIISELYNMSDHLPIVFELEITDVVSRKPEIQESNKRIFYNSTDNSINIKNLKTESIFHLVDMYGKTLLTKSVNQQDSKIQLDSNLKNGFYVYRLSSRNDLCSGRLFISN